MKNYFALFLAVIIASAPVIAWALPPRVSFRRPVATATNGINHATFNGSSYLRASDQTVSGLSYNDTQYGSFAAYVKFNNNDGTAVFTLSRDTIVTFQVVRRSAADGNVMRFLGYNTVGTLILDLRSTASVTSSSGWTHVFAKWDTNDTSGASNIVEINGVGGQTRTVNLDSEFAYAETGNTRITIGADANDTPILVLNGAIGELWFDDAISGVTGSDFYTLATGNAVALGNVGQTPNTLSPPIYFSAAGSGASWNSNSGAGPELTLTGSLSTDATPPQFP